MERATLDARALEVMDLEALRDEWRRRIGPPPKVRSVDLLRRILAWRIQAEMCGGLDAETRRALRSTRVATRPVLQVGACLTREWQGRAHVAEVLPDGFLYEGKRYRSLSAVARQISGSRWNGPRFFGLRVSGTD
nr:DUF2924 domain-containing protein [Phenylobacterium sp.]